MTSDDSTQSPADLTIEVYTAPGRPFTSAVTPEGPGDLPTWSPSSATLIYGDHDAILVDTLVTYDQVDALADWIDANAMARFAIIGAFGWVSVKTTVSSSFLSIDARIFGMSMLSK